MIKRIFAFALVFVLIGCSTVVAESIDYQPITPCVELTVNNIVGEWWKPMEYGYHNILLIENDGFLRNSGVIVDDAWATLGGTYRIVNQDTIEIDYSICSSGQSFNIPSEYNTLRFDGQYLWMGGQKYTRVITDGYKTVEYICGNYVYYPYRGNKEETFVMISKYLGDSEIVVVPTQLDGYMVGGIEEKAFAENSNLKVLVMGDYLDISYDMFGENGGVTVVGIVDRIIYNNLVKKGISVIPTLAGTTWKARRDESRILYFSGERSVRFGTWEDAEYEWDAKNGTVSIFLEDQVAMKIAARNTNWHDRFAYLADEDGNIVSELDLVKCNPIVMLESLKNIQ